MNDLRLAESSLCYGIEGAFIDILLFFKLVRGSPHKPFDYALVVFFLSLGGRLFISSDVSLCGIIVAFV